MVRTKEERQAQMAHARAAKAQKPSKQEVSLPQPSVPSDGDKLDAILALGQATSAKLEALESRLTKVEGSTPKFQPMELPEKTTPDVSDTYRPPDVLLAAGMKSLVKDGDTTLGGIRNTDQPAYVQSLPPSQRPIFQVGSQVRLNPDAKVFGSDGRTYRDVYGDKLQGSGGIGKIKNLQYISKTWEPKYTVRISGVTQPSGSGFRESELLPA